MFSGRFRRFPPFVGAAPLRLPLPVFDPEPENRFEADPALEDDPLESVLFDLEDLLDEDPDPQLSSSKAWRSARACARLMASWRFLRAVAFFALARTMWR